MDSRGTGESDARDCRENFAPVARRERKQKFWSLVLGAIGACFFIPLFFWTAPRIYIATVITPLAVGGAMLAIWSVARSGSLKCPACSKRVEALDRFCPVCGTDGLKKASGVFRIDPTMHCQRCDRDFFPGTGVNRKFEVRYCTHCDALLDNDGV